MKALRLEIIALKNNVKLVVLVENINIVESRIGLGLLEIKH
jgi:hypothetical protein